MPLRSGAVPHGPMERPAGYVDPGEAVAIGGAGDERNPNNYRNLLYLFLVPILRQAI